MFHALLCMLDMKYYGEDKMTEITAPMPGVICKVNVKQGDKVVKDQEVVVLEAMKMEMPIVSTDEGIVIAVNCQVGDAKQGGDMLIAIE